MSTTGVLYVAAGEKYIQAAVRSAWTVRRFCADLPVHIYCNWQEYDFKFDPSPSPFNSVAAIEHPHRRSKLDYLPLSPFENTLYLDSDTALRADIREMFILLERFDIALAHAHRRLAPERTRSWRLELPPSFPQFNSGVLLYRNTPPVKQFLDSWIQGFQEAGAPQDQLSLRELLWLSDLRIATLPPEYNVRFVKYHYIWGKQEARTRIFHLHRFHAGRWWFLLNPIKSVFRQFQRILGRAG